MESVFVDIREQYRTIKEQFGNKDYVSVEELIDKIYDLANEIENLKEEQEKREQDIEDNYERIPYERLI